MDVVLQFAEVLVKRLRVHHQAGVEDNERDAISRAVLSGVVAGQCRPHNLYQQRERITAVALTASKGQNSTLGRTVEIQGRRAGFSSRVQNPTLGEILLAVFIPTNFTFRGLRGREIGDNRCAVNRDSVSQRICREPAIASTPGHHEMSMLRGTAKSKAD